MQVRGTAKAPGKPGRQENVRDGANGVDAGKGDGQGVREARLLGRCLFVCFILSHSNVARIED